jgi:hypothetical protein
MGVFKLTLGKRGDRLGWKSADGMTPSYSRIVMHATEPGVICWNEHTGPHLIVGVDNIKGVKTIEDVMAHVPINEPIEKKALASKCKTSGMSVRGADGLIAEAIESGQLHEWKFKRNNGPWKKCLGRQPQPPEKEPEK